MKAYSMDLRERIVEARRAGESVESVAHRFGVCTKTVRVYEKRAAQGRLSPTPRPGRQRRLSQEDHAALGVLVQGRSDWTLASLSQAWQEQEGDLLPSSTLHDALGRIGITFKKSRLAQERCEVKRAAFRVQIAGVPLEQLVFLDECGFALNLHRLYGWALKGKRCCEWVPFNKGKNRSVLGAYGWPGEANPTGLWAVAQRLGAWKGDTFEEFVSQALLPQLPAGSVLVMDNARIHHRASLHEKVEAAGCRIIYLPPYSPDFNPIELVWSWLKDQVRLLAPRTDEEREDHIQAAAARLPPHAAKGWFHLCGIL